MFKALLLRDVFLITFSAFTNPDTLDGEILCTYVLVTVLWSSLFLQVSSTMFNGWNNFWNVLLEECLADTVLTVVTYLVVSDRGLLMFNDNLPSKFF